MSLKQRIRRLENKAALRANEYAHLTDDELRANAVRLAIELQASGPLDPETVAFLNANDLWLGDEPR